MTTSGERPSVVNRGDQTITEAGPGSLVVTRCSKLSLYFVVQIIVALQTNTVILIVDVQLVRENLQMQCQQHNDA